jgi:hypothetical protein
LEEEQSASEEERNAWEAEEQVRSVQEPESSNSLLPLLDKIESGEELLC